MKKMKVTLLLLLVNLMLLAGCNSTNDAEGGDVVTQEMSETNEATNEEENGALDQEDDPNADAKEAGVAVINKTAVTLRVEYADATMFETTEVVVPEGATFADYGFEGLAETDYATPLHALAQLFVDNGASKEAMLEYIGASDTGFGPWISGIDKDGMGEDFVMSSGVCAENSDMDIIAYSWMFAIDDIMGAESCGTLKLEEGNDITFFASYYSEDVQSYYADFEQTEYEVSSNETVELKLLGESTAAWPAAGISEPIADAKIVVYDEFGNSIDELYESTYNEEYPIERYTDEAGNVSIDMAPIYELLNEVYGEASYNITVSTIKANNEDSDDNIISRAKANIALTGDGDVAIWTNFRNSASNNASTSAKTPTSEAAEEWVFLSNK